ncbi:helix-turn-helix transcriptional regulator [Arthrobacter cryoconiti]|uniref:Helix-turn-helix transcriptional regulator n=1 Tax=Arthrobacter cryoconiti TaxID=748907 RepID=A0ABV8R3F3_9MICC|nr:YafY family protein [Arthrobacter cryoconiti]MCC9066863.1 YafY family transcriptional regulator [Arthrobacter cryoconiti]
MNRTERLYALVEELRAVSPRPRSVHWLAARFEVSSRTIERDINALQRTGASIWAEPGRTGGYCLNSDQTLPPVNFTPQEAAAMSVALQKLEGTPFWMAASSGLRKLVSVMKSEDAAVARDHAGRIHFLGDGQMNDGQTTAGEAQSPISHLIADALSAGHVLRIGYTDSDGNTTNREIEPVGYIGSATGWYLIAWCRLRDGVRVFRTDRITTVVATTEKPARRELSADDLDIRYGELRQATLH